MRGLTCEKFTATLTLTSSTALTLAPAAISKFNTFRCPLSDAWMSAVHPRYKGADSVRRLLTRGNISFDNENKLRRSPYTHR
jgi:hypothetical protein